MRSGVRLLVIRSALRRVSIFVARPAHEYGQQPANHRYDAEGHPFVHVFRPPAGAVDRSVQSSLPSWKPTSQKMHIVQVSESRHAD